MTVSPELESELDDDTYRQQRMEMLAEAAVVCRPRLFAIHGLCHNPDSGDILGWGLEFPDDDSAIFAEPPDGGIHYSDTADRVRQVLSIIADVRLTWLDE